MRIKKVFVLAMLTGTAFICSCKNSDKEYFIPEINMHVAIPTNLIIQDSFPKPNFVDEFNIPISDTTKIQELEKYLWKTYLLVKTGSESDAMSINIVQKTDKTGDFKNYIEFSKKMMGLQQFALRDSSSSTQTIDNVSLYKFQVSFGQAEQLQHSAIYLAEIKNYYLVIKSDYANKEAGDRFEKIISSASFKK